MTLEIDDPSDGIGGDGPLKLPDPLRRYQPLAQAPENAAETDIDLEDLQEITALAGRLNASQAPAYKPAPASSAQAGL